MDKAHWNEMVDSEEYTKPVTRGRIRADQLMDMFIDPITGTVELVEDDGITAIVRVQEFRGWTYHIFYKGEYVDYCATKKEAVNWTPTTR